MHTKKPGPRHAGSPVRQEHNPARFQKGSRSAEVPAALNCASRALADSRCFLLPSIPPAGTALCLPSLSSAVLPSPVILLPSPFSSARSSSVSLCSSKRSTQKRLNPQASADCSTVADATPQEPRAAKMKNYQLPITNEQFSSKFDVRRSAFKVRLL